MNQNEIAYLAGGCFWCLEAVFQRVSGVKNIRSGYSGGTTLSPTYEQVSTGETGHAEVVEISFDPSEISFENIYLDQDFVVLAYDRVRKYHLEKKMQAL